MIKKRTIKKSTVLVGKEDLETQQEAPKDEEEDFPRKQRKVNT